ncbi:MAG: hypothetical protein ACJZZ7_05820 [Cytophagales bacterium]|nr:MAG: hypothetical protein CNE34_00275 [Rhodothermaeota bacterium MED-G18]|tara:strand:+ start:2100 stop:2474 length:375 start_codon:yes stop_codon:yes gene_type:complete
MKKLLIISVIFIISSCTKKIDLTGDWKADILVINNSEEKKNPFSSITYFKADNYVIYFNKIYRYELEEDSIAFYNSENPTEIKYKMGIDLVDDNNIIFYYSREVVDSTNSTIYIPYHSKWKRLK